MQPQTKEAKKHKTLKALKATGLVILIVALGAGGWLIYKKYFINTVIEAKVYKYQNLDSYTISTSKFEVTFDKPVELHEISKTSDQAELEHIIKGGTTHRGMMTYAATAIVANKASQRLISPSYPGFTNNINTFINDRTPTGWQNNLGPAKQFTNRNIKSGAWLFDLTSSYSDKMDKGEALYIISDEANYYFFIESTQQNWNYNQQIWLQILDSIAVR